MSLPAIEALLQAKIGLDAIATGRSTISRAVQQRLSACGELDTNTYLTRLESSPEELSALIEAVVVPETWFFRDREAYALLKQFVQSEWLTHQRHRILHVLSVPCSTGEEPYSIAIALLEAGLLPEQFTIDAVDISHQSLRKARKALYPQYSFRGDRHDLQKRYFTPTPDGYELCQTIRQTVNFFVGNLLEPQFLLKRAPYQIIFCRNLLIYFVPAAKAKAVQILDRLLAKEGLLFVGHSETRAFSLPHLVSARYPLAFAFRKTDSPQPLTPTPDSPKSKLQPLTLPKPLPSLPPAKPKVTPPAPPVVEISSQPSKPPEPPAPLEIAQNLADLGQLDRAAQVCETYLSQNPISAEAYCLLGQVHQATGNETHAKQCFEKAIYLNPKHYESLVHLALLKEQEGDRKGANMLRQRIQRLKQ